MLVSQWIHVLISYLDWSNLHVLPVGEQTLSKEDEKTQDPSKSDIKQASQNVDEVDEDSFEMVLNPDKMEGLACQYSIGVNHDIKLGGIEPQCDPPSSQQIVEAEQNSDDQSQKIECQFDDIAHENVQSPPPPENPPCTPKPADMNINEPSVTVEVTNADVTPETVHNRHKKDCLLTILAEEMVKFTQPTSPSNESPLGAKKPSKEPSVKPGPKCTVNFNQWDRIESDVTSDTKNFQPIDDKKKTKGSSGMVWENQMVDMVKHLNKTIDKSSAEYKKKKKRMLAERRAFIKQKKMEIRQKEGHQTKMLETKVEKGQATESSGQAISPVPKYKTSGTNTNDPNTGKVITPRRYISCEEGSSQEPQYKSSGTDPSDPCIGKVIIPRQPMMGGKNHCMDYRSRSSSESTSSSCQNDPNDQSFEFTAEEMNRIQTDAMESMMKNSLRAFIEADCQELPALPAPSESSTEPTSDFLQSGLSSSSMEQKCRERLDLDGSSSEDDEGTYTNVVRGMKCVQGDEQESMERLMINSLRSFIDAADMKEDAQKVDLKVEDETITTNIYNMKATVREVTDTWEDEGAALLNTLKALPDSKKGDGCGTEPNVLQEDNESMPLIDCGPADSAEAEAKRMQERFQYHATSLNYFHDEEEEKRIEQDLDRTTAMFESYLKTHEEQQKKVRV